MTQERAPSLKLPRLPERTPVKMTIALDPATHAMLQVYAALYRETYGLEEPLSKLIPYMLKSFLESDRRFLRARQARASAPDGASQGGK